MRSRCRRVSLLTILAGAVAAMAASGAHLAQAAVLSGTSRGLNWTAANTIVGQRSSGALAQGGAPIYAPVRPFDNGVVALIMNEGAAGSFLCSGALLPDRRSVVTAAHCVSKGFGSRAPVSTTAYFYGGPDPDATVTSSADATALAVSRYDVDPAYSGETIDQNDIAVLTLAAPAPAFATAYQLYDGADLGGLEYNVAGYGRQSDVGGAKGFDVVAERLRQGDNRYDFRLGDPAFGGLLDAPFFSEPSSTQVGGTWLADFDSGFSTNDSGCRLAGAFGLSGSTYCDTGLGALEVSIAPGDSGGPSFVDGRIAAVSSYILSFGRGFGDIDDVPDASWGDFNGFVPVGLHRDFILGAMVPEPQTWAMMIVGFGLAGAMARRRLRSGSARI